MSEARKPIRVLVIDDSALMRKLLAGILERDPDIEVVGAASTRWTHARRSRRCTPTC